MKWLRKLFGGSQGTRPKRGDLMTDQFFDKTEAKLGRPLDRRHLRLLGTVEGNLTIHMIGRPEIEKGDISRIYSAVNEVLAAYKGGARPLQTVHFGVSAYDDDDRALFDIPEMRSWCMKLCEEIPFIFTLLDAPTIDWFFPCVADIEVVEQQKGRVRYIYKPGAIERMNEGIMSAKKVLCNNLASTREEFDKLVDDSLGRIRSVLDSQLGSRGE